MVIVEVPVTRMQEVWAHQPAIPKIDMYLFWETLTGKELDWKHEDSTYTFWVMCEDELEAVEYKLKWL